MAITAFTNLAITLSDGGTVPSVNLSDKIYVDIGCGNILKISWNTPTAANNAVDNYKVYVQRYDSATSSYKYVYNANVGNVNEFYLTSSLLNSVAQSNIPLRISVEAISKYGASYNGTSNVISTNVGRGTAIYTKVEDGYKQPVLKRAVALAKLNYVALLDVDTNNLSVNRYLVSADDKSLFAKAASTQDTNNGWALMKEFYAKNSSNKWQLNDATYELTTDVNGETITDTSNSLMYTR